MVFKCFGVNTYKISTIVDDKYTHYCDSGVVNTYKISTIVDRRAPMFVFELL